MTLTLHGFSGAPRVWRVLVALVFKDLAAEYRIMSFADGDHKKPAFLKLNPRGTAPVLETDTGVLSDSIAILGWLDRAYPARPLFGENAADAAEIWQITMEVCDYFREANQQFLTQVFPHSGEVPPGGSDALAALTTAADLINAECLYLDNILSDGRLYLSGKTPGGADAVAYPEARLLQRAIETKAELVAAAGVADLGSTYPNLAAWLARLNGDAKVAATLPAHWNS